MATTTTPKTMAEVLASSMNPSNNASNNNKNTGSNDNSNSGGTASAPESKEENDSSNVMIKTFPCLTITVYIPTACVGVLIGKRGSNIDSIQKLAAKESTKLQTNPRGPRNKYSKQNKNNPKAVSPDSVRISVVNYPPPPSNSTHNYESHFTNLHNSGLESLLADRKAGRVGGTTAVFGRDNNALYFSKEVVPFTSATYGDDEPTPVFHHVGVYAYRPKALADYASWPVSQLETLEGLEQLRFLFNGATVKCVEVEGKGRVFWELNNPEDVPRIESVLADLQA